jgi:hypothetical protein
MNWDIAAAALVLYCIFIVFVWSAGDAIILIWRCSMRATYAVSAAGVRFLRQGGRVVGLLFWAILSIYGQNSALQCVANATTVPRLNTSEITALAGDLEISCTGGTPTPAGQSVPLIDVRVHFNTNYAGRSNGAHTEALLLVDLPQPANQAACSDAPSACAWVGGSKGVNVFQAETLAPDGILFVGVPLDPPGDNAVRRFTITNIRLDASKLRNASESAPSAMEATATTTGPAIANSPTVVGYAQATLRAELVDASGDTILTGTTGVELPNCLGVSQKRLALLRFSEQLGGAPLFRPRGAAPATGTETSPAPIPQNAPGVYYNTETGFYNPGFPASFGMNKAGLADFGTRIRAGFSNLPSGVTLYVSTVPATFVNGTLQTYTSGLPLARLVSSSSEAFSPVPPTDTIDGIPVVALTVTNGSSEAVWEILSANAALAESLSFPVFLSYPANSVGLGSARVTMGFAPVSADSSASDSAAMPRFADLGSTFPLFTTLPMCPGLEYIVTTAPAQLQINVDGQVYQSPHSFAWQPGSTHTVSVAQFQLAGPGVRQSFAGWSDGGAESHLITVPPAPITFTANFKTQYRVDLATVPASGLGTVSAVQVGGGSLDDRYFDAGSLVRISAVPSSVASFAGFSGDLAGSLSLQTVTLTRPLNVTATFVGAVEGTRTIGITPGAGQAYHNRFDAVFQGVQGAQSLRWVQVLFAVAPDGGGQSFCFIHYDVPGGAFWLYSDVTGYFQGPAKPGAASIELQGSSCALDPQGSSVSTNGARLQVSLNIMFKATGARKMYLRALDMNEMDTGWIEHGAWTQVAVANPVATVTPATGGPSNQRFNLTFSQIGSNFANLPFGWNQFLVASDSTGGNQPFCLVHYDRAADAFWLYSSDFGFFLGPVNSGVPASPLETSACSLDVSSSVVTNFSSGLTLNFPLAFKASMSGPKKLYMRSMDQLQRDSGWQEVGSYQVP